MNYFFHFKKVFAGGQGVWGVRKGGHQVGTKEVSLLPSTVEKSIYNVILVLN